MEKISAQKNIFTENHLINNYRSKKVGDKFLVTTDHGSWIALDKDSFKKLGSGNIEKGSTLFKELEDVGIILTKENLDNIVNDYRKKLSFLFQGTRLHIVIPTLRCNQKCIYCHASSKPASSQGYDMDQETAKNTVDFIFQSPSQDISIEFQGGEPLLNFDIVKYITEYANQLNKKHGKSLKFSLVSNFSLVDEEKLDYLIKNKVGICTSLDGPEFIHNKNRLLMGGNSYKSTVESIEKLKNQYKKMGAKTRKVNALLTVTKDSLPYYKEIIDEYVKLGMPDIFLRFLNDLGDARPAWKQISYSADDFIDFWKKSMDYIIELNTKGKKIREWFVWLILQKIVDMTEPSYFEQRSPCGAAIGQLAYNYNGDIYTCDEARMVGEDIFKLGNVKENNYSEVLTSNQTCSIVSASVNETQICDYCAYKPYCGLCPVCNYAEQGNMIGKITETARCKIYKAQFDYIFEKFISEPKANKVFISWLEMR